MNLLYEREKSTVFLCDKVYELENIFIHHNYKYFVFIDKIIVNLFPYILEVMKKDNICISVEVVSENIKSIDKVKEIYSFLIKHEADKESYIVGIGGGVIGDLFGYIAATYLGGLKFVSVPTTLLAQSDSCIGGKNGINFVGYKNIIGTFYHPHEIWICSEFRRTLDIVQFKSGLAEIIGHALIRDKKMFEMLDSNIEGIISARNISDSILLKNCFIKYKIVELDEKDHGIRAILNFGHTFGHAIEAFYQYKYQHGTCVAVGIVAAYMLALNMNLIDQDSYNQVISCIARINYDIQLFDMDISKVIEYMQYDKKHTDKDLTFILPFEIGEVGLVNVPDVSIIINVLEELKQKW